MSSCLTSIHKSARHTERIQRQWHKRTYKRPEAATPPGRCSRLSLWSLMWPHNSHRRCKKTHWQFFFWAVFPGKAARLAFVFCFCKIFGCGRLEPSGDPKPAPLVPGLPTHVFGTTIRKKRTYSHIHTSTNFCEQF